MAEYYKVRYNLSCSGSCPGLAALPVPGSLETVSGKLCPYIPTEADRGFRKIASTSLALSKSNMKVLTHI